jgi:hypothetical protein
MTWKEAAEMAGGILFLVLIFGFIVFMTIGLIVVTGGWALLIPVVFGIMVLIIKFTPLGSWMEKHV